MKIVLASNNRGKLAELQAMLTPWAWNWCARPTWAWARPRSRTAPLSRNALAKARFASQHTGLPALADDAGLCVDAFGGLPGVDTAYYATQFGYEKSDDNNVRAPAGADAGPAATAAPPWSAPWWPCAARRPRAADCRGPRGGRDRARGAGSHGFGFDPVMFIPEFGQTFAELPPK